VTSDRGQTTIDFAIGVSLFLLVVVFVFLFVPDLLEPFNSGTQEETVAVNRVADELSQRQLGNAGDPYVVSTTCAVAFFDNETGPSECTFAKSGSPSPVGDQLDLTARQRINVTITRVNATNISDPDSILCWDDGNSTLTSKSDCTPSGNDVDLQRGEDLPLGSSSSVSARRVLTMDGQAVSMTVVVW